MPKTDPTATAPLTRWPHTGVVAPFLLTSSDYREQGTGNEQAAFTATLHHPDLGPVGVIEDDGDGTPTHFTPSAPARFSAAELDTFVRASRQDGAPFRPGPDGVGQLLCAVLDETEAAKAVHAIRGHGKMLVRGVLPAPLPGLPAQRHRPRAVSPIPLTLEQRATVETALSDTADPKAVLAGLWWEMFNGREWTPLVALPGPDVADSATLRAQIMPIVAEAGNTVPEGDPILNAGPVQSGLLQGMYVNFRVNAGAGAGAGLRLIGDAVPVVHLDRWCDCHRIRPTEVRFHVIFPGGHETSGTVHAAKTCRRLLTLN
ncbi:hypothetical protein ALI22I_20470 [Saccharothrix sp. ALI-22-I]|uniref:hypothetical protein n=1 Tax=Saccharothrix sp. ALI-22-I TaxID=1933778 RepID=UPI00097BF8AF|nr:hypothetical protein [Saccharothrix sp. ALI-22-I]ONI88116.1 hypothetical protein ALI22I_20470 [Saccharothrix sp. ALI-22-I]